MKASFSSSPDFAPVVVRTCLSVRVVAANLTDTGQRYEDYALRIFQELRPDIVTIQKLNCLGNTAAGFRVMLDSNFGANFLAGRRFLAHHKPLVQQSRVARPSSFSARG